MITVLLIYVVGVVFAFISAGYYNDLSEAEEEMDIDTDYFYDRAPALVAFGSWLTVIIIVMWISIAKLLSIPHPSASKTFNWFFKKSK